MTQSFVKQNSSIKLAWNQLTLVQASQAKTILNNLSGQIKNGQFLTIMGSSGAGKSTLLSLLTKSFQFSNKKFSLKGTISLNNHPYTQDDFYSIASYVPQDDLLLGTLTVQEVFNFQASLKLHDKTEDERKSAINQVLMLLNLYEVRNSFIGGNGKKSISGGQRKRVAIGIQLISNPMAMILDEPTSGLDSSNSLKIIQFLSKFAKQQNKLIIATIHQPSTLIFNNFDKLMILHKGNQIFLEQANKILSYMNSLNIKIDERMNPADFFMLEISSFKESQQYTTPMASDNFLKFKLNLKPLNPEKHDQKSHYQPIKYADQRFSPLTGQLKPLLIRNMKNFMRNPSNQGGRFMQLIVFPFLIGTIFFDLMDRSPFRDPSFPMQTFLLERISFFYIGLFFTILQSVYDTLLAFPTQKQLVLKQVHSRMYYMSAFYISKLIIELPLMFLSVIVSCSIVFLIIGFENTLDFWLYWSNAWFNLVFSFSFVAFGGYMIGVSIGAMCKSQFYAVQAGVMIMMPVMTFGGQGVNLNTIPSYASWMQYLTPLRYGYTILMRKHLSSEECGFIGDNPEIQDFVGLKGEPIDGVIGLILLCYGLTVLSFVILYIKRKFG